MNNSEHHSGRRASVGLGPMRFIAAAGFVVALFSVNPLELIFAIALLYAIIAITWRIETPAVAVALLLFPWLEITAIFVEANITRTSIYTLLNDNGRSVYWACALGLSLVLAGFWKGFKSTLRNALPPSSHQVNLRKLVIAALLFNFLITGVGAIIGRGSSLFQLNTYLGDISYVLLIAASIEYFQNRRSHAWFWGFFAVSFALSFYSFFSEWKNVLICLLIGASQVKTKINFRFAIPIVLILLIGSSFIQLWQAIKPAYRMYLSDSARIGQFDSQRVTRTRQESLAKFYELSVDYYTRQYNNDDFQDSRDFATFRRIGYLEYFSMVANRMPHEIDHERGRLFAQNASFAFVPRFINPNKGVKDDRAKVEKYTGLILSRTSSFSLGHYTEYFIDFGIFGMLIILFFYGRIGGLIYKSIYFRYLNRLGKAITFGVLFVILRQWGTMQNDCVFLFGYVTWSFIIHGLLLGRVYEKLCAFILEPLSHHSID